MMDVPSTLNPPKKKQHGSLTFKDRQRLLSGKKKLQHFSDAPRSVRTRAPSRPGRWKVSTVLVGGCQSHRKKYARQNGMIHLPPIFGVQQK